MRHTELVLYGNFNCPSSYVASLLTDTLTKAGVTSVEWRAVEHDRTIPVQGRSVVGPVARRLTRHLDCSKRVGNATSISATRTDPTG